MTRKAVIPLLAALFSGCASGPTAGPGLPVTAAQKPEERGLLPIGRVISVGPPRPYKNSTERRNLTGTAAKPFTPNDPKSYRDPRPVLKELAGILVLPLSVVLAPVVVLDELSRNKHEANSPPMNQQGGETNEQDQIDLLEGEIYIFQHVIKLIPTGEQVVMDELWRYNVGDCIALRAEPDLIVPALPGICDAETEM